MSAERLREAAYLMRERAEAATTHTPWQLLGPDDAYARPWTVASTHPEGERTYVCENARHAGGHIASWHPAVALAVADWLDAEAEIEERTRLAVTFDGAPMFGISAPALAVADAYLGGEQR